jgi:hypothetical protein
MRGKPGQLGKVRFPPRNISELLGSYFIDLVSFFRYKPLLFTPQTPLPPLSTLTGLGLKIH